ncbi:MAG: putative DNA binding domain-containing protein [Bacteroidetes bacterium]|nr:putative DNA binding domain-containing protein [Bacteroidota bacterium]
MENAKELLEKLNLSDECTTIEAKKGTAIHRSVLETVCAFANEPGLGGGNILLGVQREENLLFPSYIVCGVENPDKLQLDLSTQCADIFNQPVRPEIIVENIGGKNVINVFVPELQQSQKPVYFKSEGLPKGAFRRIGSSDQRCTDDDLFVFFNKEDSLDSTIIKDTSLDDVSEEAVQLYRNLRSKVNPYAEELQYDDIELLQSLGCIKKENATWYLTYAGLLVFGKRQSHRRLLPMVRVDYIRVPGNEWVENPEKRFTTIDMRGPLIELVSRAFNAIADDLPKGFLLPEGEIQADSIGLPSKVLREAIVNAFIHRTYRENQPIQIIRYGNRLEIKNPGFSLKPEDQLGEPGSRNRNPFIAAIFHETNLAETKGSGIRTMRSLMEKAELMPPTFESDHTNNQFTTRLLLHHFLNESDLKWLIQFNSFELTDTQKRALIFLREVGALDNATHRQLNGLDVLRASSDLRGLRDKDIVLQKGKGRSTYYIANPDLTLWAAGIDSAPVKSELSVDFTAPVEELSAPVEDLSAPVDQALVHQLPKELLNMVEALPVRVSDPTIMQEVILQLCAWKPLKSSEMVGILGRSEKYLLRNFISPLREEGKLEYTHPEMPNHPQQAYKTVKNYG